MTSHFPLPRETRLEAVQLYRNENIRGRCKQGCVYGAKGDDSRPFDLFFFRRDGTRASIKGFLKRFHTATTSTTRLLDYIPLFLRTDLTVIRWLRSRYSFDAVVFEFHFSETASGDFIFRDDGLIENAGFDYENIPKLRPDFSHTYHRESPWTSRLDHSELDRSRL